MYHPDRPTGDEEMFELVTHAYNVLVNPQSRADYDTLYRMSKQSESDHFKLKAKSDSYYKAQKTDVTSKLSKEELKKEFDKSFDEFDRKHCYDRKFEKDVLKETDLKKLYADRKLSIEQEDTENLHDKLFDNGRFDIARFNAAFDIMHKGSLDVIPHTGNPSAYNFNTADSYVGVNNIDNLYAEDDNTFTADYGSVNFLNGMNKSKKLTAEDVKKIKKADYVKNHNKKDSDYNKYLEERMREYGTASCVPINMEDYDTDPNCGGFSIFKDIGGAKSVNTLQWDNDEDIKKRYERLLEMRKQDIN